VRKRIPSLAGKKKDLETKKGHLEKTIKKPILKSFPKWQKEERQLRKMQRGVRKLKDEIVEPVKKVKLEKYIPKPEKGTPNYEEIAKERETLIQMAEQFQELGKKLEEVVSVKERALETYIGDWRKKYEKAQKQHERVIKTARVKNASALTSEIDKVNETVEADLEEAEDAARQKKAIETELKRSLIPEYSGHFGEIFKKRLDKARGITESLKSFVRVHVLQMSDRSDFEKEVERLGKGSRLRGAELQSMAAKVTPIELAELILDRNSEELSNKTGIKTEKIGVFIECAWAKNTTGEGFERPSQLYKTMLTELKDSVNVELHVGEGLYKPMNELSVGSKCTAILSVALVEGRWPLIVDQPEDALDNPFVFEQIVKTVRRSKTGRQYIFATHNPNVAVSSDADLIYCLKASASEGGVDKQGSIDEMSTKDRIVANLEGGKSAFRLRSQKYDIVVEDPNAVVLGIDAR
jgi:ABC-type Na+ transport system ATPase subunit NatA